MRSGGRGVVFWLPRVLVVLFVAFISLFSLDVFDTCSGVWDCSVGLFMHSIPALLLIAALAVAWRRPWLGAILFTALGLAWIAFTSARQPWSNYLIIAGPPIMIGGLFLLEWLGRARPKLAA